jgi:hypothetical protein
MQGAGDDNETAKPYERLQYLPAKYVKEEPGLKKCVAEIIAAAKTKNTALLLSHIDQKIQYSFGADISDKDHFVEYWELEKNPKESKLWDALYRTLRIGGTMTNPNEAVYPFFFVLDLPAEFEPYDSGVITGFNVNIRKKPSLQSEVITKLSYDVVKNLPAESPVKEKIGNETHPWIKILTYQAKEGYVYGKFFRHIVDYRAYFTKKKGLWKMTVFIAGD